MQTEAIAYACPLLRVHLVLFALTINFFFLFLNGTDRLKRLLNVLVHLNHIYVYILQLWLTYHYHLIILVIQRLTLNFANIRVLSLLILFFLLLVDKKKKLNRKLGSVEARRCSLTARDNIKDRIYMCRNMSK